MYYDRSLAQALANTRYAHWLVTETVGKLHRFMQIYKEAMDRRDYGLWHRADGVMGEFMGVFHSGGLTRVLEGMAELPAPLVDNGSDDDEAQMHCEDDLSTESHADSVENNGDEQRNIAGSFERFMETVYAIQRNAIQTTDDVDSLVNDDAEKLRLVTTILLT